MMNSSTFIIKFMICAKLDSLYLLLPISMFLLFVIGGCVIIIAIIAVMVKRLRLTKQSEQLSAKIRCIPSYESNRINEERRFAISTLNERFFADIATDLEACFANCYITFTGKGILPLLYGLLQGSRCARSAAQGFRY